MLSTLSSFVVPIIVFVILMVIMYDILLSDIITNKLRVSKQKKLQLSNVLKIAKVKLVSDDTKDIAKFIESNTEYLSNEMVQKLVDRIEIIKTDQIINADTILKSRINPHVGSTLSSMFEELGELEEVEALAKTKTKTIRKRK